MRKRILILLGGSAALLLLAVATLPWWMGLAVRQVGGKYGLTFASYTNVGYGRWAIEDATWEQPGIRIGIGRVEGPHPLAWWWQRTGASSLVGQDLVVNVNAAEQVKTAKPSLITGPYSLVSFIQKIRLWLPPIELRTGTVSWSESQAIKLDRGTLVDRDVTISGVSFRGIEADVTINFAGNDSSNSGELLKVVLNGVGRNWDLSGSFHAPASELVVAGQWLDQQFEAQANFKSDHWIPDAGRFEAENWVIPGAEIGLTGKYRELSGRLIAGYSGGEIRIMPLSLRGAPAEGSELPPLEIAVEGASTFSSAKVERLSIEIPGLTLIASKPFEISRETWQSGAVSELDLSADLAKLPLIDAAGRVTGRLTVTAREEDWPLIAGELHGDAVSVANGPGFNGDVAGQLSWPQWTIGSAVMKDEFGGTVTVSATGDAKAKSIESANWTAVVSAESLHSFVPPSLSVGRITARGEVSGSWPELIHSGSWDEAEFEMPPLKRMKLQGSWTGVGTNFVVDVLATAGLGRLAATAQASLTEVVVEAAKIDHESEQVLRLIEPITIAWSNGWNVAGGAFEGPGFAGDLDYLTALKGSLSARAEQPNISWINDWWTLPPEIESIESLQLVATWDEGPLEFTGRAIGQLKLDGVGGGSNRGGWCR